METGLRVSLLDVVLALATAVDSVSPVLAGHHAQVAIIAENLAAELGLCIEEQRHLIWAGLLHDIGAFSIARRLELLDLDDEEKDSDHGEIGFRLANEFRPFSAAATLIRHHHIAWNHGRGQELRGDAVPLGSHVLHLADRVAVMTGRHGHVLGRVGTILERIEERTGKVFQPDLVEALRSLASKEVFWLDATSPSILPVITARHGSAIIDLDLAGLTSLAEMFCHVIDFRSPFTATHSQGVAASAEALACASGLSTVECRMMRVAGYLHDLGKLVVPAEILQKPTGLSAEDWFVMKRHPYVTWRVLGSIPELEAINSWASCHHERLNGEGYPFHYRGEELSYECRILAVADVFTALTEDRPYRPALSLHNAMSILQGMADNSVLDPDIARFLSHHLDEINSARFEAQQQAAIHYDEFRSLRPSTS